MRYNKGKLPMMITQKRAGLILCRKIRKARFSSINRMKVRRSRKRRAVVMNLYPVWNELSELRSSFSSFRSKPRTKMLAGITMAFVAPILLLLVLDPRLPK